MDAIDLAVARRVVPELIETLRERGRVLNRIRLLQPIGRRVLALELGTTERILRAEVDFLRKQGLVVTAAAGMSLSDEGHALLDELGPVLASIDGRSELESTLSRLLSIPTVRVVPGDSDDESWVKETLGYQAAAHVRGLLRTDDVLAVTGGTTLATFAHMMPVQREKLAIKVVPARGGLGETVSVQANTIAGELAEHLGGTSIMLHVPDRLSEETLEKLTEEPQIQARLDEIRQATVVVHGIGDAVKMAERRQLTDAEITYIKKQGGVAEAFGYYFNQTGESIYAMTTVGLRMDDIVKMRLVIGVAGGHTKANAVAAVARAYPIDVLITDEGAARKIVENIRGGI